MEIEIDPKALIDSPYNEESAGVFSFDESLLEDFVNEISYGTNTCYLVSGYRGVGKTSLIKRAEQSILERTDEVVFVYLNFAGYKKGDKLERKLIRELFLKIRDSSKYKKLDIKEFKRNLETLYQRTFNEITEISSLKFSKEKVLSIDFSVIDLIKKIAKESLPWVILLLVYLTGKNFIPYTWIIEWMVPIGSILLGIISVISINWSYSKRYISDAVSSLHF